VPSFRQMPKSIVLESTTISTVHGGKQLRLFNAFMTITDYSRSFRV